MLKAYFFSLLLISLPLTDIIGKAYTVSGIITDEEHGAPIPGVNVMLKGTALGTISDLEGRYQINIAGNTGILVYTLEGLVTKEIEVSNQTILNVSMRARIDVPDEKVVTAYNISRNKSGFGYAIQSLDEKEVNTVKEYNFINSLSGKVAGVQIRQNATLGGSTNIILRGYNFIHGDNQPLFIIDGIPIDNNTYNDKFQQMAREGYDYGNAASDINPDDIESISVLKGASASSLYGSRAANGVILINTKKGNKSQGFSIDYTTTYLQGKIDKSTFIHYQDQYGAGWGPYYGSTGYFDEYDVDGDGIDDMVVPTYEDGSYGGKFEDFKGLPVWQWDSFWPESENYGKPYEYQAGKTKPIDFFETSHTWVNSVALSNANDKHSFWIGYTNWTTSGILPNSYLQRNNVDLKASSQINKRLKADVAVHFIKNDVKGRYKTGCFDNVTSQFRKWWQVNVDVGQLKKLYKQSGGLNRTWNITKPSLIPAEADMSPVYWDNPYWTCDKNYNTDNRNRIIGALTLNYELLDWLSLLGRISMDSYREIREERRAMGSVPAEFGINKLDEESGYNRKDLYSSEYNFDFILTADTKLTQDISFYGILGANIRRNQFDWVENSISGGLVVPGLYTLANSAGPLPVPVEVEQRKEVYGYFTNLNIGFKSFLYLDLVGRVDISSALPVDNNTYPYGSASLGWVFSEHLNSNWLDFGKVRLSYAEVGNDTKPNLTTDYYVKNSDFGDAILFTSNYYKSNENLKPEELMSWDAGLEIIALNDRVGFDIGLYRTSAVNQLIYVPVSSGTGYRYLYVNGGEIENKGVELTITGDIFRSNTFDWTIGLNWTKNKNEVKTLPRDAEEYRLSSFCAGVSNYSIVGQPYGIFKGTGYQYINGQPVVNSSGYYIAVRNQIIGDPNPKWHGGIENKISYKQFSLGFMFDISKGGNVFSADINTGQAVGLPDYTAVKNDLGNPARNSLDEGGGLLLKGVTENGAKNNIRARADYYGGVWYWGNSSRNPMERHMYDASYVKLRELYLTYYFPENWINSFAQKVAISFVGRNLWILSKYIPFTDPESGLGAGNVQGYLSGSYPAVKYFGVKFDITL